MSHVSRIEHPRFGTGFSLLEILVALSIFAIASMIAYRGLDAATSTKNALDQEIRFWREMGLVFDRMETDFLQGIPHPLHENDEMLLPPVRGDSSGENTFFIELVRQDKDRSPIHIRYYCNQGNLMLSVRPMSQQVSHDRNDFARIQQTRLLHSIKSCEVGFLNAAGNTWLGDWPGQQIQAKPRAVRIRLAFDSRGHFERIFLMP